MIDLLKADYIDIRIEAASDGLRVWVNDVNGCVFRAYRVKNVEITTPKGASAFTHEPSTS